MNDIKQTNKKNKYICKLKIIADLYGWCEQGYFHTTGILFDQTSWKGTDDFKIQNKTHC